MFYCGQLMERRIYMPELKDVIAVEGLVIPPLAHPTLDHLQFGSKHKRPNFQIVADHSPEGAVVLQIARVVMGNEETISAQTYLRRVNGEPALGLQHAEWLKEHFPEFASSVQEAILDILIGNSIDFSGFRVKRDDGSIGVPVIMQTPKKHKIDVHFMSIDFVCHRRVALGQSVGRYRSA